MNNELKELYQQVILDHNKNPRNWGKLENATHEAEGHNPLCGDQLHLYLILEGDKIIDVKFIGNGCAISKASASVMTTIIKNKTIDEVKELFHHFHDIVTSDVKDEIDKDKLGKLSVFAGVREFPVRVKCASLSWHTLMNALDENQNKKIVSTE